MSATGKAAQCWLLTPTSQVPVAKPMECRTPTKSHERRDESGRTLRNMKKMQLEMAFRHQPYLIGDDEKVLAQRLGLTAKNVRVSEKVSLWFWKELETIFLAQRAEWLFSNFSLLFGNIVYHFFSMTSIFTSCTIEEKLTKLTCNYLTTEQVRGMSLLLRLRHQHGNLFY